MSEEERKGSKQEEVNAASIERERNRKNDIELQNEVDRRMKMKWGTPSKPLNLAAAIAKARIAKQQKQREQQQQQQQQQQREQEQRVKAITQKAEEYFKDAYSEALFRQAVVREHVLQATERSRRRAYEAGKTYDKNSGIRFFKIELAAFKVNLAKTLARWATYRASDVLLSPFTKNTSYRQIHETVKQGKAVLKPRVKKEFTLMVAYEKRERSEATLQEAIERVRARHTWLERKGVEPSFNKFYNSVRKNIRVPGFSHEFIPKIKEDKDIEGRKELLEKLAEENYTNTYGNEGQFLDRLYKDKYKNALPYDTKEFLKKLHKARFIYQVQKRIVADAAGRSRSLENKALLAYLADVVILKRELIATGISEEALENLLGTSPVAQDHRAVIVDHFIANAPKIVSSREVQKMIEFLDQLDKENILSELSRGDIEEILKEKELDLPSTEKNYRIYKWYSNRVYSHAHRILNEKKAGDTRMLDEKKVKNRIVAHINKQLPPQQHEETKKRVNALLEESIVLKLPEEQIKKLLDDNAYSPEEKGRNYYINDLIKEARFLIKEARLTKIAEYGNLYKLSEEELTYVHRKIKTSKEETEEEPHEQWVDRVEKTFKRYAYNRNYVINFYIKKRSNRKGVGGKDHESIKKKITDILSEDNEGVLLKLPKGAIQQLLANAQPPLSTTSRGRYTKAVIKKAKQFLEERKQQSNKHVDLRKLAVSEKNDKKKVRPRSKSDGALLKVTQDKVKTPSTRSV